MRFAPPIIVPMGPAHLPLDGAHRMAAAVLLSQSIEAWVVSPWDVARIVRRDFNGVMPNPGTQALLRQVQCGVVTADHINERCRQAGEVFP